MSTERRFVLNILSKIKNILNFDKHIDLIIILILISASSVILFNNLGAAPMWLGDEQVHFQWADHVVSSGDYLTPWAYGQATLGIVKPPLIIWLMSFTLRAFEQNFAIRFWSAFFGVLCSVILYYMGKLLFNRFVGISSSLILLSFTSFYTLSRIGLFDVPFLSFILASLYLFLLAGQKPEKEKQYAIISGVFFGLALMTKQLSALLIPLIILMYLIITRRKLHVFLNKSFLWFLAIGFIVFSPWLIMMSLQFGTEFFSTYFDYAVFQRATTIIEGKTSGYFFYFEYLLSYENLFWLVLLPVSFGLTAFYSIIKRKKEHILLLIWVVVILGVFTFSQTKLSHYILPVFPAFAIMISVLLYGIFKHLKIRGVVLLSLLVLVLLSFTLINAQSQPFIELSAETHSDRLEETKITSISLLQNGVGFPQVVSGGYLTDRGVEFGSLGLYNFNGSSLEKIASNSLEAYSTINAVALGDIDSDNQTEIVSIGTCTNNNFKSAQMSIWNSTDLELERKIDWSWGAETTGVAVAVGDLRNTGQMQIVTAGTFYNGTYNVAMLCIWNGSNLILEKSTCWATSGNTTISSVTLSDLDNDELLEIIVGGYYFCGDKEISQITVWNSALEFIMDTGVQGGINFLWNVNVRISCIAVGDVDEDTVPEIVSGGFGFQNNSSIAQLIVWNSRDLSVEKTTNWNMQNSSTISSIALSPIAEKGFNIFTAGGFSIGSFNHAQIVITDGSSLSQISSTSWSWNNGTTLNAVAIFEDTNNLTTLIFSGGSFNDGTKEVAQLVASKIQK